MKSTLLIIILLLSACVSRAQKSDEGCIENRTAPAAGSFHWPPDTEVKVYFARAMFTAEQREKLLAAVNSWSEIAARTGSGVSFVYAGETDMILSCHGCLIITRRSIRTYALFDPVELNKEWLLISARIDFDLAITNPQALQSIMTHELGHGLGLRDCVTCKKKTTIMNGFPAINRHNGLIAPSTCDVEVVREIYKRRRRGNTIVVETVSQQHQ